MDSEQVSRRAALRRISAGLIGGLALSAWEQAPMAGQDQAADDLAGRFPALALRISSPGPGQVPLIDFQAQFGAIGDGAADDGPAFHALAAAINSGTIPAGSVAYLSPGRYRIQGNQPIRFTQPVVLRGAGPGQTVIQPEYSEHGTSCIWASGRGMYVTHSTGLYNGRQESNRYSTGTYAAVMERPTRGQAVLQAASIGTLSPGDDVYLICDDYGETVSYAPANVRAQHYLLKQHLRVAAIDGDLMHLDQALRHDFGGASPRLYRWSPLRGFGLEHLTIEERNTIPDSEQSTTFRTVRLEGTTESWVWDVHFRQSTSIPLAIQRSRSVVVSECLFDGALHLGGGGNGYLPELYQTDDSLVEYCTVVDGRHALICNWTCWGNVFRYNRVIGTQNIETHGEYSVENLYWRNEAPGARIEIGGGGNAVHAHDGPFNELRENHARRLRVLKPRDDQNRLIGNWHVEPTDNRGSGTELIGNVQVPSGWDSFPYGQYCGHDHSETAESALPRSD